MTENVEVKNNKRFKFQLKTINFFESLKDNFIKIYGMPNCKSTITKEGRTITLKISGVIINEIITELPVKINNTDYILKSSDLSASHIIADKLSGIHAEYTFDITEVATTGFKKDSSSKFRCFFPVNVNELKSFIFMIDTILYSDEKTTYFYDCIRIKISDKFYDILQVKNEGNGYYIIENLEDETLKEFRDNCFAIQQVIGFITGYMPGGEEYIFSDNEFINSNCVRPGIKSIYTPVNSNSYSKLYDKKESAAYYHGKLNRIPVNVVSKLTEQIKNKPELSSAIILLLEAASVKSLLLIPSVFSVVIESLSKIIFDFEIGKFVPIENKEVSKTIIKELSKVIDLNSNHLNNESILKLKRRILAINQPVMKEKLTNNEKLTLPFEKLKIKLSIEDIKAIEHRNDLLHGNILLDDGELRTVEESNQYMAYIGGKLYTLISKLILKNAGYSGYVINHGKLWYNLAEDEDYYELI